MSGHSKWAGIKHKKAVVDAKKGQTFTKVASEITVAAREAGPDPTSNFRLRLAMQKAREVNMPADNIDRAIKRGTGEVQGAAIEEIRYEGYGPAGVAVIVDAATDNRNRTASELRFLFSRGDGTLGETGSVGWMFVSRGIVEVEPGRLSEDELTEKALVDGVIDVRFGDPAEIVTEPQALMSVKDALERDGLLVRSAQLGMEATQLTRPRAADVQRVLAFLDALEEHEDVQRVYSNAEFDEAELEAFV